MKNVTILNSIEYFRVPGPLLSPLWSVKYVSGLSSEAQTKPGHWLVKWEPSPDGITFAFGKDGNLFFTDEASAESITDQLRKNMSIVTEVVNAS